MRAAAGAAPAVVGAAVGAVAATGAVAAAAIVAAVHASIDDAAAAAATRRGWHRCSPGGRTRLHLPYNTTRAGLATASGGRTRLPSLVQAAAASGQSAHKQSSALKGRPAVFIGRLHRIRKRTTLTSVWGGVCVCLWRGDQPVSRPAHPHGRRDRTPPLQRCDGRTGLRGHAAAAARPMWPPLPSGGRAGLWRGGPSKVPSPAAEGLLGGRSMVPRPRRRHHHPAAGLVISLPVAARTTTTDTHGGVLPPPLMRPPRWVPLAPAIAVALSAPARARGEGGGRWRRGRAHRESGRRGVRLVCATATSTVAAAAAAV